MEKLRKVLFPIVLIIVLLIPIIVEYVNNHKISVKSYSEYKEDVKTSDFLLVYFGDTKDDNYKNVKKTLSDMKLEYQVETYSVNINKLSGEETDELVDTNKLFEKGSVYALIKEGEVVKVIDSSKEDYLNSQLNKYINNVIPKDEIAYKTVETYKEFNELYKSKNIIMHVFGRNTCYYCNIFKPVYNEVASDNNLDIYYYDSDSFDSKEYNKILNSGINIPAECTTNKEEVPLSSGFGTPLTLFTKNGKVVGCISGYVNKTKLEEKLKEVGMLK